MRLAEEKLQGMSGKKDQVTLRVRSGIENIEEHKKMLEFKVLVSEL